jgi:hypothetical protein
VIPFYNRFDLLKEAILSVLSSDFSDLEIILAYNASDEDAYREPHKPTRSLYSVFETVSSQNLHPAAANFKLELAGFAEPLEGKGAIVRRGLLKNT